MQRGLLALVVVGAVVFVPAAGAVVPGQLDPAFGVDGVVVSEPTTAIVAIDATSAAEHKLVVAGFVASGQATQAMIERRLASGALDTAFGAGGRVLLPGNAARAVASAADGSLVVALTGSGWPSESAITRLLENGDVDSSFGEAGYAVVPALTATFSASLDAIAIGSDGSVVAGGMAAEFADGVASNRDFLTVRLDASGNFVDTFDADGLARLDLGGNDAVRGLTVDDVGRPVLVGGSRNTTTFASRTAVVRLTTAGAPDTSFAGTGIVLGHLGQPLFESDGQSIAVDSNGNLVVLAAAFSFGERTLIARLLPTGALDPAFSTVNVTGSAGGEVAVDEGDRVVAALNSNPAGADQLTGVYRFLQDGAQDTTWPFPGFLTLNLSPGLEHVAAVIAAEGRITVVDTANPTTPPFLSIVAARIVADDTQPKISPVLTGPLGNGGWYIGDLSLRFNVTPASSSTSGCEDRSVTADTGVAGTTFTCAATSQWGEVASTSITIRRDATPPTLICGPSAVFLLNQVDAIVPASLDDAGSGPDPAFVPPSASTDAVGPQQTTVTGTDVAGNEASAECSYQVVYRFDGWKAPLASPPVVNVARAGGSIHFVWQLFDANDGPVTGLGSPLLSWQQIPCPSGATEQQVRGGGRLGFSDDGAGGYKLGVRSPRAFKGTCQVAMLDLGDGEAHTASFRFV